MTMNCKRRLGSTLEMARQSLGSASVIPNLTEPNRAQPNLTEASVKNFYFLSPSTPGCRIRAYPHLIAANRAKVKKFPAPRCTQLHLIAVNCTKVKNLGNWSKDSSRRQQTAVNATKRHQKNFLAMSDFPLQTSH
jgi:hypothetical protein